MAASGVFAGDEFVFDVGVADDDAEVGVVEGDLAGGAVAAVDEGGVAFCPWRRCGWSTMPQGMPG